MLSNIGKIIAAIKKLINKKSLADTAAPTYDYKF